MDIILPFLNSTSHQHINSIITHFIIPSLHTSIPSLHTSIPSFIQSNNIVIFILSHIIVGISIVPVICLNTLSSYFSVFTIHVLTSATHINSPPIYYGSSSNRCHNTLRHNNSQNPLVSFHLALKLYLVLTYYTFQ